MGWDSWSSDSARWTHLCLVTRRRVDGRPLPEIEAAANDLPDGTVLDGEILACDDQANVLPFAQLQRRIGRKTVGKKLLAEVPVKFFAFDLLEVNGQDIRSQPFDVRRSNCNSLSTDSSDLRSLLHDCLLLLRAIHRHGMNCDRFGNRVASKTPKV